VCCFEWGSSTGGQTPRCPFALSCVPLGFKLHAAFNPGCVMATTAPLPPFRAFTQLAIRRVGDDPGDSDCERQGDTSRSQSRNFPAVIHLPAKVRYHEGLKGTKGQDGEGKLSC
jgi:hypothetical protein